MTPVPALLWRNLRVYQIYGANTEVGKTVFSTILCKAASRIHRNEHVSFLKPVSTGPEGEADSLCIHIDKYAPSVNNRTLFQYELACSPHSSAKLSTKSIPSDDSLRKEIYKYSSETASKGRGWLFIETAGGVHSPGPSGTVQADLYAALRVPVILVGDSKLGGISQTIAAFESLKIRGYDVEAILLFSDGQYENHEYLRQYFSTKGNMQVESFPQPPSHKNDQSDQEQMSLYYQSVSSPGKIDTVLQELDNRSRKRIERLEGLSRKAKDTIWYPFTQQKLLSSDRISAIDSAHGDYFQVPNHENVQDGNDSTNTPMLKAAFDGSASWWTQGLGHANPNLTLAASYAAGRYGHVMFAEAIHEPALALAESLLQGMKNPRLTRVFYSDNGSTGCEVAVKMALRAARTRYGWSANDKLDVLGLQGAYHGDTIGAMDCSDPGPFNEKVEWYEGKGHWFNYPTVRCHQGEWVIDVPGSQQEFLENGITYKTLNDVFDLQGRSKSETFKRYTQYIYATIEKLVASGRRFGALMLEPVILGAGGMIFVDPLFQKALVEVVRSSPHLFGNASNGSEDDPHNWSGLPVVFDEVFTGLYRLGRFTASSFLDTHADISVHAKLLTGGLVPLCTTLASESVFRAFESEDKTDALLHGHSYTAHPVGCQVALESLKELQSMDQRGDWDWAKENGWTLQQATTETSQERPGLIKDSEPSQIPQLAWSMWSCDFVEIVSQQTAKVDGVWALGSVLAISMRAADGAGYTSRAAADLQAHFRGKSGTWNAHTRVLGNVFYIMASQTTSKETVDELQNLCLGALNS